MAYEPVKLNDCQVDLAEDMPVEPFQITLVGQERPPRRGVSGYGRSTALRALWQDEHGWRRCTLTSQELALQFQAARVGGERRIAA